MISPAHIIGTQVIDVEIDVGEDFFALQQEISRVFHARVAPALDTLFSGYVGVDTVLRLDRLVVDVGRIDRARLEDELAARVVEALEPVLAAQLDDVRVAQGSSGARRAAWKPSSEEATDAQEVDAQGGGEDADARQTIAGHTIELWHYFLRRGHFPWWAPAQEPSAFEARVIEALEARPALLRETQAVARQAPVALRRLALQFSEAFLDRLVRVSAPSLSPRLLRAAQDVSQGAAGHPAWGIEPRLFRQLFRHEALRGVLVDGLEPGAPAEQTVVRRALQRVSRRLSVRYPDLLGRIQATLQEAKPGTLAPSERRLQRLVAALALTDDPAEDVPPRTGEHADRPHAVDGEDDTPVQPSDASPEATARQRRPVTPHPRAEAADEQAAADAAPDRTAPDAGGHAARQAAQGDPVVSRTPDGADEARVEAAAVRDRSHDQERRPSEPLQEGTAFYVDNAGLVLLHPYLKAHFDHLGFLGEEGFVDENARQRAIYQLQYLATGSEEAMEYSLTLNKLLCGYPLEEPLARDAVLGDAGKAEAENLLKAVIRNWPALKNTSPDGLREGFLQRDGKLTRKPFSWLLQVEQKSYDILLGHLPWGIGLIKLPWMPEMLHVEWA